MKRIIPIVIIFLFFSHQLSGQSYYHQKPGQWYYRHHGVTDPKDLTLEQFNISEKKASNTMLIGGGLAFAGFTTLVIMPHNMWPDTGEAVLVTACIISVPVGFGMLLSGIITNSKISKSKKEVFPETGYLKIQPTLIYHNGKGICPGITFSVSF